MLDSKKRLFSLIVIALLTLGVGACSGEYNPSADSGTDQPTGGDGGNDGGDGGNDGGSGIIDPTTGTWENKDEDGDGVLDEDDDFPFDSTKSQFVTIIEEESNNLISEANEVGQILPIRIKGSLSSAGDTDTFSIRFPREIVEANSSISFVVKATGVNFAPTINLFDKEGNVQDTFKPSYFKQSGVLKSLLLFYPKSQNELFLSVSSSYQEGAQDYTIDAFVDSDRDGLSDMTEYAIGTNVNAVDSDNDSIIDSIELYVLDIDGSLMVDLDMDNKSNAMDDDSDGDGLLDKDEGGDDLDGDTYGNFVDLDSDGNDLADVVEAENVQQPTDSDYDGVPDYKDLDDDNDTVRDLFDMSRLQQAARENNSSGYIIKHVSTQLSEAYNLSNQGLRGKHLAIRGGLTSNKEYVGILEFGDETINVRVMSDSDNEIEIHIPRGRQIQSGNAIAFISLYDAAENRLSNRFQFDLIDPQVPIVTGTDKDAYEVGEIITVNGWNFTNSSELLISNTAITISELVSSYEAKFKLPNYVSSQSFSIRNGWGVGNSFKTKIFNKVDVELQIPQGLSITEDAIYYVNAAGDYERFYSSVVNRVAIPPLNPQVALFLKSGNEYFDFFTTPILSNELVTISLDSTLWTWVRGSISEISLAEMIASPAYEELYQSIYSELEENPYYFNFDNDNDLANFYSLIGQFVDSYNRGRLALEALSKVNHAGNKVQIVPEEPDNPRELQATIRPEEVDDIKVTELSRFFTGSGFFDFTWFYDDSAYGYTNLNNDTQLYLSAGVIKRLPDGELADDYATSNDSGGKSKKYDHITNLGDSKIISPAYFSLMGFELLDTDVALRVCKFDDCRVEVLTPGFESEGNIVLNDLQARVVRDLRIRTILERAVWGPLKAVLEFTGIADKRAIKKVKLSYLYSVLEAYYPDVINAIATVEQQGGSSSNYDAIGDTVKGMLGKEVKNLLKGEFGPLTKVILAATLDESLMNVDSITDVNLYKELVEEVIVSRLELAIVIVAAKQAAQKAVPILGQAELIYDIAKLTDGIAQGAGTIVDLTTVKTKIDFDIAWGIEIKRMSPAVVEPTGSDIEITIEGVGYCIEEGGWFSSDEIPQFSFSDFEDTSYAIESVDIQEDDISDDCREIKVKIPGAWAEDFYQQGRKKVRVDVSHRDDSASSAGTNNPNKEPSKPPYITFGEGVAIGNVNPDPSSIGQVVEVSAIGFSPVISENSFYLTSKNGGFIEIPVMEFSSDGVAKIKIPVNAISGELILEVNNVRSEPYDITIIDSRVLVRFGDNGNLEDDQFTISYQGTEVSRTTAGQRKKDVYLSLSPGRHSIVVKGVYAPDLLATYYFCSSENSEIVRGESIGRITTDEESNESGLFENRIEINVLSSNSSEINTCEGQPSNSQVKSNIMLGD
ncbi:IPT/TIG domain-containing protein [Aliikangiella sp. IMCC44653]